MTSNEERSIGVPTCAPCSLRLALPAQELIAMKGEEEVESEAVRVGHRTQCFLTANGRGHVSNFDCAKLAASLRNSTFGVETGI